MYGFSAVMSFSGSAKVGGRKRGEGGGLVMSDKQMAFAKPRGRKRRGAL